MRKLGRYSLGLGDRFGHQGNAQLKAITEASVHGVEITPVWNKSDREHNITGTLPEDVRNEADTVTTSAGFRKPYFVDADHVNFNTVDRFIGSSDFFTIDVASYIGKKADRDDIESFLSDIKNYTGILKIPGIEKEFTITKEKVEKIAEKYLFAAIKAWDVYRKIEKLKGKDNFITEISMDEVHDPQSPVELFFILKMLALENIPLRTIAPKFTGRFNKGIDYKGSISTFSEEFEADLMVIDYAIKEFGLPDDLKISIHSGSDKFSIYPVIGSLIEKHDKGVHVKTAGTTWLEEVIGLSLSGGAAFKFVRELYYESLDSIDELSAPYSDVIDIKISSLPSKKDVSGWENVRFASALRNNPDNKEYNPNMRQLIHVAYKLAAMKKNEFYNLLHSNRDVISQCVYENIYERHIKRIFNI